MHIDQLTTSDLDTIRGAWLDLMLSTPECEHTTGTLHHQEDVVVANPSGTIAWIEKREQWCVVGLLARIDYAALLGEPLEVEPRFAATESPWEHQLAGLLIGDHGQEQLVSDNDHCGDHDHLLTFRELAERVKLGWYDHVERAVIRDENHGTFAEYLDSTR